MKKSATEFGPENDQDGGEKIRRGKKPSHTTPKPKKQNPISAAISSWLRESRTDLLSLPAAEELLSNQTSSTTDNENPTTPNNSIETVLIEKAPKRWVVYEPMVLLPSGSFTSAPWPSILASSTAEQKRALWTGILREISPSASPGAMAALTHLAINEGIPPLNVNTTTVRVVAGDSFSSLPQHGEKNDNDNDNDKEQKDRENTLRSPTGLKLLHGDFGPALPANQPPTRDDFEEAFWVSTKQNGITQIWAPRYTMFSRGNIKEKTRLLTDFSPATTTGTLSARAPGGALNTSSGGWRKSKNATTKSTSAVSGEEVEQRDRDEQGGTDNYENKRNEERRTEEETRGNKQLQRQRQQENEKWAIDLYAGIGYFVFSYAKLGFRLLCWEINPWSVEGLRRGAVANGWDVVVLSPCSSSSCSSSPPAVVASPAAATCDCTRTPQGSDHDEDQFDDCDKTLAKLVIGAESANTSCTGTDSDARGRTGTGISAKKRNATNTSRPQIIVLLESNEFAERRVRRLRESLRIRSSSTRSNRSTCTSSGREDVSPDNGSGILDMEVVHINCGFLPSSSKTWEDAWRMIIPTTTITATTNGQDQDPHSNPESYIHNEPDTNMKEGWLHLHENVGIKEIENRRAEIQGLFDKWSAAASSSRPLSSQSSSSSLLAKAQTGSASVLNKIEEDNRTIVAEEETTEHPVMGVQAKVEHVEMVKTFAPDVWHVVFDVHVTYPGYMYI